MKKLFALIKTEGKTKEQIVDETWNAYQKYIKAGKKPFRKYIYIAGLVILALAGYLYITNNSPERQRAEFSDLKCPDDYQTVKEKNDALDDFVSYYYEYNPSGSLDYLAESRIEFYRRTGCDQALQRFSNSKLEDVEPGWSKIAESCTKIGEKIFCKLKGE